MSKSNLITQEYLQNNFIYKDGHLYKQNGDQLGNYNIQGYLRVRLFGKWNLLHRLIYLYHTGTLPEMLDHIDGNRSNNKIENLRPATKSQNAMNSKQQKNTASGIKGIVWHKKANKWMAQIAANKISYYLGYYDNLLDAKHAIDKARKELHNDFAKE